MNPPDNGGTAKTGDPQGKYLTQLFAQWSRTRDQKYPFQKRYLQSEPIKPKKKTRAVLSSKSRQRKSAENPHSKTERIFPPDERPPVNSSSIILKHVEPWPWRTRSGFVALTSKRRTDPKTHIRGRSKRAGSLSPCTVRAKRGNIKIRGKKHDNEV
jgi:hypothetical protein